MAFRLTVKLTARCGSCPRRFTPTIAQLRAGGGVYCSSTCRAKAQERRLGARTGRMCAACGGPRGRALHYGLEICLDCRAVAWRTCWRKRPFDEDPGSEAGSGLALRSYRCPLCPQWHQTKEGTAPPQAFLHAQVRLARLFAEVSFDIDRHRSRSRPAAPALGGTDASLTAGSCSDTHIETEKDDHV